MLELLAIPVCMIAGGLILLFVACLRAAGNQAMRAELDTRYPDFDDELNGSKRMTERVLR